jgi:hypothetical protein
LTFHPLEGVASEGQDARTIVRAGWKDEHMPMVDDRTKEIVNILATCVAECAACAKYCGKQGNADMANCIALCTDCADLCGACIPLVGGGSPFTPELCRLCADACDQCAAECERLGMTECAEACRKAADACRQMANA